MYKTTLRATVVAGILTATALIASPLTAVADEAPTYSVNPKVEKSAPDLRDDIRTNPAVEKAIKKMAASGRLNGASTGNHKIYVSAVNATTTTSDDDNGDISQSAVIAAIAQVSAFWNEQSNGAVSFSFGGYETYTPNSSTCSPDGLWNNRQLYAFGGAFNRDAWVGTGKHLLVLTKENAACEQGAGFGTLGGDGGVIFTASGLGAETGLPVLFHEYGHNLGLGHADAAICRTKSVDGRSSTFKNVPYTGSDVESTNVACASEEYGDLLDIMGYTVPNAAPHASALERLYLGWTSAVSTKYESAPTGSKGSSTSLIALNQSSGVRLIAVTDPRTGERYYVEFRTNAGRDATALEWDKASSGSAWISREYSGGYAALFGAGSASAGAVRVLKFIGKPNGPAESTVLAVSPFDATGKARLLNLPAGKSFTSVGGGTNIYVSQAAGNAATVKVTLQKYASTTTFSMKSKVKRSKAKATVTVKVVGGSKPAGTITAYNKGKKLKTYTISTSKNGKITVTLPKLKKGKAKITFKYNGNSKIASDVSPAKTVKVK